MCLNKAVGSLLPVYMWSKGNGFNISSPYAILLKFNDKWNGETCCSRYSAHTVKPAIMAVYVCEARTFATTILHPHVDSSFASRLG